VLKILATLVNSGCSCRRCGRQNRALQAKTTLTRALKPPPRDTDHRHSPAAAGPHELERVSEASASVLLLGESGTGKELFARAVHLPSSAATSPSS
jgi:Nif-specific regulatory protein